jgi:hypothetical protein
MHPLQFPGLTAETGVRKPDDNAGTHRHRSQSLWFLADVIGLFSNK